jgi:hypothetical protein
VGRNKRGFVVTGGSRMTGSCSGCEKLLVRARGMSGAGGPGTEGGTIWSGSKKYIHLAVPHQSSTKVAHGKLLQFTHK